MSTKKKPSTKAQRPQPSLRHAWLAGLGVLVIARRQASAGADSARQGLERIARQAQASVRHSLDAVRAQGQSRVGQFSAEVEARLAPVLGKFGLVSGRGAPVRGRKVGKTAGKTASAAVRKRPSVRKAAPRKRRA